MLGSSTLGIGLTMFLRDQFSGPASRIRSSNRAMQQDMRRMNEDNLRYQRNVGAGVAMMGGAALVGLSRAVKESAKFGYEMAFVRAVTNSTTREMEALGKQGMRLGAATMFKAQDVAEGMRFMAMAGMNANQVSKNIEGAVTLAGATKSMLGGKGGASDIMTNVMKQFSIDFANTQSVADVLAYGTTRANTNLFDLGEALKYAGSTSMDLNVGLNESVAMVMALGNAGMQGSMAGVAMENSMRYLARAFSSFGSGTSKKGLAALGLTVADVTDEKGNLISMTEVMQKFGVAMEKAYGADAQNIEKNSILQTVFGVRGKRAASLLIRNLKEFSTLTADISTKSGGHAQRVTGEMMNSLEGQILQTTSAWANMWIAFTDAVEPFARYVLHIFKSIAQVLTKVFQVPYLGTFLSVGFVGFTMWITAVSAFKAAAAGIRLITMQNISVQQTATTQGVAGWNAQTAAALRYASAARMAGTATKWGGIQAMTNTRRIIGGMSGVVGMRGQQFVRTAGKGAGRYVAGATAMRYAAMYGGRAVGGKIATGVLARAIGFLGGPLGIALSFVLPAAISALVSAVRGNGDSTDKNTEELRKSKERDPNMRYGEQFVPNYMIKSDILSIRDLIKGGPIRNQAPESVSAQQALINLAAQQQGDIVINIDGETIFRTPRDTMKEDFKAAGIM